MTFERGENSSESTMPSPTVSSTRESGAGALAVPLTRITPLTFSSGFGRSIVTVAVLAASEVQDSL